MSRRSLAPHYVGGAVVAVLVVVVAALANTSLTAGGRVGRFEAAAAAVSLSNATAVVAAGGLVVGLGLGLVLGGLWAYHGEVADR